MAKKRLLEDDKEPKAAAPAKDDADKDAEHDDAAADKELIKKALVKHLGEEPNDEVMKHAHEAYMAASAHGMKQDEAMETVGHAMKMAKIMHAHQAKQAEAKAKEDEAKACEDEAKKEAHKEEETHKESAAKPAEDELLKLRGEVASLKESIKKRDLADYMDAKLAETKLARTHTKTIKESLAACRSEAEVDQKIKLFLEGYKAGSESGTEWVAGAEKTEGVKAGVSFADCVL